MSTSMEPSVTYDSAAKVIEIRLADGSIAGTIPFPDSDHLVDVDERGRVVGLEILTPERLMLSEIAERFGIGDIDGIYDAVARQVSAQQSRTAVRYATLNTVTGQVLLDGASATPSTASAPLQPRPVVHS